MRRRVSNLGMLHVEEGTDPIKEFFDTFGDIGAGGGGKDDDAAAKAAAAAAAAKAGDSAFNFPDEPWVPPQFKGKTPKEVAEITKQRDAEFTRVNSAYAESTKLLERIRNKKPDADGAGSGGNADAGNKPNQPDPVQETTTAMLLEMRVERFLSKNEDIGKYRDEIMELLSNIHDPRIRLTDDALAMVANQIRGNHHKEILEAALKQANAESPATPLEGMAFGGTPPHAPGVDLRNISDTQKANLASWYEGDINKAKESLLPKKE